MFFRPSLSAVALVTATSLDEVNGVGGSAVMPSFAMPVFTSCEGLLRILRDRRPRRRRRTRRARCRCTRGSRRSARPEGLQRGLLVAEVELRLRRVARRGERLRVDLAEHLLLGEVLRADRERRAGVRGVLLDRVGGLRGRRAAVSSCRSSSLLPQAAIPTASASTASAASSVRRCLGSGHRVFSLRGVRVHELGARRRPRGVTARPSAAMPSSRLIASSAIRIDPASRPVSP